MLINDGPVAFATGPRCIWAPMHPPSIPILPLTIFCTALGKILRLTVTANTSDPRQ